MPIQLVPRPTEDELQIIYRDGYWNKVEGDLWPKGPDQVVFDIGVNSEPARGLSILGQAMGVTTRNPQGLAALATRSADKIGIVKRACARRAGFYRSIRTFAVFGRGWLARNARMEAIGVRMALEAQGVRDITGNLKREAAGAQKRAKRSGNAAATAGGGTAAGSGGLTQADAASWDWTVWLTLGFVALAAVTLTLALVWAWQRHGERAKAYAAALRGEIETDLGNAHRQDQGGRAMNWQDLGGVRKTPRLFPAVRRPP
jgi:lysozyme family protein